MVVPYKELFIKCAENHIEYLVAGGFAVNFHQVQRATMDLDLILHLSEKNVKKFTAMVKQLGFVPRAPVDPNDLSNPIIRRKWKDEKNLTVFSFNNSGNVFEVIDIFIQEPKPFIELYYNKMIVKAFGIEIPVVGVQDLIEMKTLAGRDKDLFDVKQLLKKMGQNET